MLCATSLIVGLHMASYHFQPATYYPQNNVNPGVYAECDGWTAGAYRNTLDRPSVYAGYTWHRGSLGLSAGAVSGYQRREGVGAAYCPPTSRGDPSACWGWRGGSKSALSPMVVPHLTLGPARLWFIPKVHGTESAVIHLSLQSQFR